MLPFVSSSDQSNDPQELALGAQSKSIAGDIIVPVLAAPEVGHSTTNQAVSEGTLWALWRSSLKFVVLVKVGLQAPES